MDIRDVSLVINEWQTMEPAKGNPLYNVFLTSPESRRIAEKLTNARLIEIREHRQGLCLKAFSNVGHIKLDNIHITIKPKIDGFPLFQLLRYAYNLKNIKIQAPTQQHVSDMGFQDLLIYHLIIEISNLYRRGLFRKYLRISKKLAIPRGRIDLQKIAKKTEGIESRLPCNYYPRSHDCLPNQIIFAGLQLSAKITQDLMLRSECRRLAAFMGEGVTPFRLDYKVIRLFQRTRNRLTAAYEPSIGIIEMLMRGHGITFGPETELIEMHGFLFDMNRFFQALLSKFFHENLKGFQIRDEYRIKGMLTYLPEFNPGNRRAPSIKPDFILQEGARIRAVLDAKYRDLWDNYLPRDMLYQLSIYSLTRYADNRAVILYPTLAKNPQEAVIQINEPVYGGRLGQVIIRPVNLLRLADLVGGERTIESMRQCAHFARELAFGKRY